MGMTTKPTRDSRKSAGSADRTPSGRSAAGGLATTAGTAANTAKGAVTTTAGAADTAKGAVTTVTDTAVKPLLSGVAFALVVRKIMLLIRFLRELELQLQGALRGLVLRLREATAGRRGGDQEAIEDEAFEDEAVQDEEAVDEEAAEDRVDRRGPATRPARRPQSGQRPQRPARPRRDVDAPQPDAPAPAVRRAPVARRPKRPGRRGPGAGGHSE
jgi:hypothetical protein